MLLRLVMPGVLLAVCVVVHAMVMTALLRRLSRAADPKMLRFWHGTWVLIRVALWMLSAHLLEIAVWAYFLVWQHVFPDARTAFYFSAVTYTTVGYGDVVLPEQWRILVGVEGLTGILMCGWSTGIFYAVVSKIYSERMARVEGMQSMTSPTRSSSRI